MSCFFKLSDRSASMGDLGDDALTKRADEVKRTRYQNPRVRPNGLLARAFQSFKRINFHFTRHAELGQAEQLLGRVHRAIEEGAVKMAECRVRSSCLRKVR
jgi:hypothetical protein